jgi:predicted nucleotide-binding protein
VGRKAYVMRPRVSVSHSHHDDAWCAAFVARLQQRGLDVWYDTQEFYVGDEWLPKIEKELEERDVYLIVLTPDSWASAWVQKELALALARRKQIMRVLLKSTQFTGSIQRAPPSASPSSSPISCTPSPPSGISVPFAIPE